MTLTGTENTAGASVLFREFDVVYFDLDGVLYRGKQSVPGAGETVSELVAQNCGVAYVTNNASRTSDEVAAHLEALGIPAKPAEVITSAEVAVEILRKHVQPGAKVFVVGGEGVAQALSEADFSPSRDPRDCVAVVQGFGPEVSWQELAQASYLIQGGAIWIATNLDSTFPTGAGIAPGNGSLVEAVRNAVGRSPDGVGGKPDPAMMHKVMAVAPGRKPLLVGDRFDTDIAAGVAAGIPTMLVLSGVSTESDVWRSQIRADFICESVKGLVREYARPIEYLDHQYFDCGDARAIYFEGNSVVRAEGGTRLERLRAADSLKWSLVNKVGVEPFTSGQILLNLGD